MIQIKHIITVITALALFSSCETTIDYDLPQEPSKITVDSKLLVGDTPVVHVFTSVSSLSRQDPAQAKNAEVTLYENGVLISKLPPQQTLYGQTVYSTNYQINPDQHYKVEVSLPEYTTVFGEGLTKSVVPITSTVYDSASQNLSFTFKDPPSSGDYYLVTVRSLTDSYPLFYSTNDVVLNFFDEDTFDDPFSGGGEKYGQKGYLSDELFNGKSKTINITTEEGGHFDQTPRLIELWRISEDLYNHERTKAVAWQSENPFSEPVQVYSNIENGYGILGTAAVSRKQFYP